LESSSLAILRCQEHLEELVESEHNDEPKISLATVIDPTPKGGGLKNQKFFKFMQMSC
jgi:hypothetical protein